MAHDHGWSRARNAVRSTFERLSRDCKRGRLLTAAFAAAILAFQVGTASATGYFVAPDGDDNGTGSIDSPWRTLGIAMNRLFPGDTLYVRGGSYFEAPRIEVSGTAAAPIVVRSYPDERGIIDSGFEAPQTPNSGAWELVNAARGEYRSTFPVSSGTIYGYVGGVPDYENGRVGLVPYEDASDFDASTDQQGSSFYVGPGTFFKSGRIHIRLDKTTDMRAAEARYGQVFAGDPPDPNDYPIYLSTEGATLTVAGSYLTFRDLTVHQAKRAIYMDSDVHDIRFEGMTVWAGNRAISTPKPGVHHVVVTRSRIFGDYPYWLFFSDMKDSPRPANKFRNTSIDLREGTHDWEFSYCHIRGAGQDIVGTHDDEYNLFFHHNRIENAGDDAFELEGTSNVGHIQIYENYIANCLSAFAPGQSTSNFGGPLLIYRNIVALLRNPPVNREEGINTWNGGGRFGYEYMFKHSRGSGDEARNTHYYQNTLVQLNSDGDGINITPTDSRDCRLANNLMVMVNGVVTGPFQIDPGLILDGNLYWKANTQDGEPLLDAYDTVGDFNAATGHEAGGLGGTPKRGTNPGFETFALDVVDLNATEWALTPNSEFWMPQDFTLGATSHAIGAAIPLPPHPDLGVLPDTRPFGDIGALPFGADVSRFALFPFNPERSPWDTVLVNLPPEANAGPDQAVTLPASAVLDGTIGDDGQPFGSTLSSVWRFVSGPALPTFADSNAVDTQVSFADSGTYVLSLTATDGDLSTRDSIAITVHPLPNAPPTVDAGPDQELTLPAGATLDGAVTDDGRPAWGALVYAWRQVAGPFAASLADSNALDTSVSFADSGTYVFSLLAIDGQKSTADSMTILVHPLPNAAPVVDAGADQSIVLPDGAKLDGSAGDDGKPDGSTLTHVWRQAAGPFSAVLADSNALDSAVSFPDSGTYLLALIGDDGERSSRDTVAIVVERNRAPWVDAGSDATIVLPDDASLSGSVSDVTLPSGAALSWVWRQVAGPFAVSFADTEAVVTQASFADSGTYVLSLDATDGFETASDSVTVVVLRNLPPAVDAGADHSITLPATATLDGTVSDETLRQGMTLTSVWRFLAGPFTPSLADSEATDTQASFPDSGTYVFSLNASDGDSSASDTVVVVVHPIPNAPPVVDAGPDQEVTFPEDAVLDGNVTDATIPAGPGLTTVWRFVSGPFAPTFADSESVDTQASFPDTGTYRLSLTADDGELSAADTAVFVVSDIPNDPPVVSTGADQTVTMPDSAVIGGSVSDDGRPDGSSLTVRWRAVSGPAPPVFADSTVVSTHVHFTAEGIYVLSLNVSDGHKSSADSMTVTVHPNMPPIVEAGNDDTITLPAAAALDGTVSDATIPTGSSLRTVWRQISGPFAVSFADSEAVDTEASFADSGTYVLSLEASDGDLHGADSLTVVVLPIPNATPTVDAGPDQAITLPSLANLDGTVDDDGLPNGSTLLTAWRQIGGPFVVTFGDSNAVDTDASFPDAGTYTLSLNAHDGEYPASDTMTVVVSNVVVVSHSIALQIQFDEDDAEERLSSNSVTLSSSDIEMVDDRGRPQRAGLRFRNVAIPAGAVITSAHLQFQVDEDDSGPVDLTIHGEKIGHAPQFAGSDGNLTSRTLTSASQSWSPPAWSAGDAGAAQRSPNLKNVVQEIIEQTGWAEGNTLAFLIVGSGERTAESHDGNPGGAARLFVEFDTFEGPPPPPPPNTAPAVDAGPDQQITLPAGATLAGTVGDDGQPGGALTHTWHVVSGPGVPTFGDPSALNSAITFPRDGSYLLRLYATDGLLDASDSLTVEVAPQPAGTTVITIRVAHDDDDAEEREGSSTSLSSSDLELVEDGDRRQTIGLRFLNVPIPRGATVLNAHVQFTVDEAKNADGQMTIRGEHGDAARFTSASGDVTSRSRTTEFRTWSTPEWTTAGETGDDQKTPDLAAIIQEIVSRNDWSSGFDLGIIIDGTGTRTAESHDGAPESAALLVVEIAGGSPAQPMAQPSDQRAAFGALGAIVVPNPMRRHGALHFTTVRSGEVRIELFDLHGRRLDRASKTRFLAAGRHTVDLTARAPLPAGLYFYRLQAPTGVLSGRFVVLD